MRGDRLRAPILAAGIYLGIAREAFEQWLDDTPFIGPQRSLVPGWVHDFTDLFFAIAGVLLLALIAFAPDLLPHG